MSNNLIFNQLTNNNVISFVSTSYWSSTEMDYSRGLFSVQLGGDLSHWSVLGQLVTLDSVSLVCTLTVGHTRQCVIGLYLDSWSH